MLYLVARSSVFIKQHVSSNWLEDLDICLDIAFCCLLESLHMSCLAVPGQILLSCPCLNHSITARLNSCLLVQLVVDAPLLRLGGLYNLGCLLQKSGLILHLESSMHPNLSHSYSGVSFYRGGILSRVYSPC